VFMDGRIVQIGSPREIFARPTTRAVAAFIGTPPMNLLEGEWQGGAVTVGGASMPVASSSATSRRVTIGVRPGDLRIADAGIDATVERVEDLGDAVIVIASVGGVPIKLKVDRPPDLHDGNAVHLAFAPDRAHLFDPDSGERLS
jgi:ABC-type sugar transport system ATPase subunit